MVTVVTVPIATAAGLINSVPETELSEFAVMVASTDVGMEEVVTGKVPNVRPCGITMLAGTWAAALLLARLTSAPPEPAGAASVTVAVEVCPAVVSAGFSANPASVASEGVLPELRLREADEEFAEVAVICAVAGLDTGVVATVKAPLVCPCGIVMLAGTEAAGLLLDKPINTPPLPAGAAKVTDPAAVWPAVTVAGLMFNFDIEPVPGPVLFGAWTESVALTVLADDAEIVATSGF
jgi:hypothetical protein